MSLEALYFISQIIASAAIVASLIFVGLQLRQSDRTQRAASLQSVLDGCRDRILAPGYTDGEVSDIFARGLCSLDSLNENEKRRFWYFMTEHVFQMQHVMQLRERQLISQVDYDAWLALTASLLKTPGGAALWPYIEASSLTPTIRDLINNYLKRNPEHPSFIELNPLFNSTKVSEQAS